MSSLMRRAACERREGRVVAEVWQKFRGGKTLASRTLLDGHVHLRTRESGCPAASNAFLIRRLQLAPDFPLLQRQRLDAEPQRDLAWP